MDIGGIEAPPELYFAEVRWRKEWIGLKSLTNMKDDVAKYIAHRKRTDKGFAKDFEAGYAEFKRRQHGRMANAITVRTLKASKAGRNVKRFGSKRNSLPTGSRARRDRY